MVLAVLAALLSACSGDLVAPDAGVSRDGGPSRDAGFAISSTRAFSVLTWNLEMFPKTALTSSVVTTILDDLRPDLVGVQEIKDEREFEIFAAELPDYAGQWVRGEFLAVGMLWRPERLRISNIHPLFERDNYAFPRAPLQADVEVLGPDGEVRFDFVFIALHLKAQVDAQSQARRLDAMEKLENYLSVQLSTGGEQDYIIVGDYNDRLLDEGEFNVFRPMLDRPDKYTFLTRGLEASGEISYIPIPGFIDHILVTNDALTEYGAGRTETLALELLYPRYVSLVSDHRPIRATFALP